MRITVMAASRISAGPWPSWIVVFICLYWSGVTGKFLGAGHMLGCTVSGLWTGIPPRKHRESAPGFLVFSLPGDEQMRASDFT